MRAIEITAPGGPEVLRVTRRPVPVPAVNEVLIEVVAAGINRPHVLHRKGGYPPPPGASDIPGLEVAGTIVAAGAEVNGWRPGDRVCALVTGGGYAEYVAAPAPQCLPIPRGLTLVEAAGLPETFFTVWVNVFERAGLKDSETLLIQGGASRIGVSGIQSHRFAQRGLGLAVAMTTLEREAELAMEAGIGRTESERVAVGGHRFAQAAETLQGHAEAVLYLIVVGCEPGRRVETR